MNDNRSTIDCILQLKVDQIQKDYFTQTLMFLAGVELKNINPFLRRLNEIIYFKGVYTLCWRRLLDFLLI